MPATAITAWQMLLVQSILTIGTIQWHMYHFYPHYLWSTETLSNLPKVTQLITVEVRIWTRSSLAPQVCVLSHYISCCFSLAVLINLFQTLQELGITNIKQTFGERADSSNTYRVHRPLTFMRHCLPQPYFASVHIHKYPYGTISDISCGQV